MKVSIFGMGYVGVVSGACFARDGHEVVGVDLSQTKVDLLNEGKSPVVEEGIAELVGEMVASGRLSATMDSGKAVHETDVSCISVGTPSRENGSLDLRAIETVSAQIGAVLKEKDAPHTIVVRSTLLPGTTRDLIVPTLERESGKVVGRDVHVCYNPEFLREGSSIKDFYDPPYTIIGETGPEAGDAGAALYSGVEAPVHRVSIEVAEGIKYVCNCFHALKVGFANEIGVIMKALGVDSHPVMKLVCEDKKLNISPAYLMPGYAFGGSCLPKDVRALVYAARTNDVDVPMLQSLMPSNRVHTERAVKMVMDTGERDVAMVGLSFKAGTDDLRESPLVILAKALIGNGCRLRIWDPEVVEAKLMGANREYIESQIPHIGELLSNDLGEVLDGAKVAVVGNGKGADVELLKRWAKDNVLLDLQRVGDELRAVSSKYDGICW